MKTIVSVTPIAVEKDSRTYKIAATFTRLGYRSIVVEGNRSNLDKSVIPFELISIQRVDNLLNNNLKGSGQKKHDPPIIKTIKLIYKWGLLAGIDHIYDNMLKLSLFRPIAANWWTCRAILLINTSTKKNLPQADLYYLHSPIQFIPVYRSAKQYNVPIIYDAHDFYCLWSPLVLNIIERWCIWNAREVITVSDGVATLIQNKYGKKPKIIRNCHDPRIDNKNMISIKNYLGLNDSDFLIVNIGAYRTEGQPMEPMLAAMTRLPNNVHLAFLGENTKNYSDLIKTFHLETRVHLLEPVHPDCIIPFIKKADASIILLTGANKNLENCLPNKLFQSISAELILLYPDLPEIQKIAEKYQLGLLIDPHSEQSIYNAIVTIMSNDNIRKMFHDNANRASAELTWMNEEMKLKDLISASLNIN